MLVRSIQRFGPLVAADQEVRLLAAYDQESDPALRTALAAVLGALRPKPAVDRPPHAAIRHGPGPDFGLGRAPGSRYSGSDLSRFRDPQSRNGIPSPRGQAVIAVGA